MIQTFSPVMIVIASAAAPALAQEQVQHEFDIPPSDLQNALDQFSRQSGMQLIYSSGTVANARSHGVRGKLTGRTALYQLLWNTDLSVEFDSSGAALITRATKTPQVSAPAPVVKTAVAEAGPDEPVKLDEIVVTAQKRSENLQVVPISITALSAARIENTGVKTTADLTILTPGLNYTEATGFAAPFLRGVGSNNTGPGVESPVATYVDGIYYSSVSSTVFALNNVQSVDVLKGPQGTLFGRNATGGVIQINTRDPSYLPQASIEASYGNYDTVSASAYLTTGITDSLAADLAASFNRQGDGYGTNLFNGRDINKSRDAALRSKWLWKATDQLKLTLIGDYMHAKGSLGIAFRPVYGTLPASGPAFSGGKQDINSDAQPYVELKQGGLTARIDYEGSAFNIVGLSGYRQERYESVIDGDIGPVHAGRTDVLGKTKQLSQELQILSPLGSDLKWMFGGYFFHSDGKFDPAILTGSNFAPLNSLIIEGRQKTHSLAGFGQVTKEVMPETNLTAGVRYTTEKRQLDAATSGTFAAGGAPILFDSAAASKRFSKLTWRLAVDHRFSEEVMGYLSYNRGFKSGLYNAISTSTTPVKAEVIDAFEAGFKSTLLDRRLRVNVAAFYYDYSNIQIPQFINGVSVLRNAAAAEIYGLDVDVEMLMTERLKVTASGELLHARYRSFDDAPLAIPQPGGGNMIAGASAAGNQIMLTPSSTASVTVDYRLPVDPLEVDASVTYYHNDGWYGDPDNVLRQPSYNMVNAQLRWKLADGAYSVAIWGRNLTNAQPAQYLAALAVGSTISVSPPRTYGVTLTARMR